MNARQAEALRRALGHIDDAIEQVWVVEDAGWTGREGTVYLYAVTDGDVNTTEIPRDVAP